MFMILNIYKGREMFDKMVRDGNFHKAIHLQIDDNFELFDKKILILNLFCSKILAKFSIFLTTSLKFSLSLETSM